MTKLTKQTQDKVSAIITALQRGAESWVEAGKMLVELVEEEPNAYEIIIAKSGDKITAAQLQTIEQFGRGLNPRVILDCRPGGRRLLDSGLEPKAVTERYNSIVPVAVTNGHGIRIEQKPICELSHREVVNVITPEGSIRKPDEQIEIIKERDVERATKSTMKYRVEGDHVTFFGYVTLTWEEIEKIAEAIKPKLENLETEIKRKQITK